MGSYGFLVIALVLECVAFEYLSRRQGIKEPFLSLNTLILVLNQSAIYGVASVGMTFVIISGGIDLSVGSMIAFGGVTCALVTKQLGGDASALAAGYAVALGAGFLTGSIAALFITLFQIPPFIATLASMSTVRGLGLLLVKGVPVTDVSPHYDMLGRYRIGGLVPIGVLLLLVVFIAGAVLLNLTRFGRHVRAIGGAEESARLSGVPVNRVKWMVYCMSSTLAVMAGLVLSSKLDSGDPNVGVGDELQVIAAVVVGGTSLMGGRGTTLGTLIGLLIIAVLATGMNWIGMESFAQQVVLGVVILAAVLLDRLKKPSAAA